MQVLELITSEFDKDTHMPLGSVIIKIVFCEVVNPVADGKVTYK